MDAKTLIKCITDLSEYYNVPLDKLELKTEQGLIPLIQISCFDKKTINLIFENMEK